MWSDCAGMCSEVFGLNKLCLDASIVIWPLTSGYFRLESQFDWVWKLRFEEIEQVTNGNVKMRTNLVGACDSNPDCLQFIDTNHSPRDLMYSVLASFFLVWLWLWLWFWLWLWRWFWICRIDAFCLGIIVSGAILILNMIPTLIMTVILNLQNLILVLNLVIGNFTIV